MRRYFNINSISLVFIVAAIAILRIVFASTAFHSRENLQIEIIGSAAPAIPIPANYDSSPKGQCPPKARCKLTGVIEQTPYSLRQNTIVSEGCVESLVVNNKPFSTSVPARSACGSKVGIPIPSESYFSPAPHAFSIILKNNGKTAGKFSLEQPLIRAIPVCIFALIALVIVFLCSRQAPFSKSVTAVLFVSILLRSIYFFQTEANVRTYDVFEKGGHLDYVLFVLKNLKLPDPSQGWEYHQPPLYYVVAALALKICKVFQPQDIMLFLQGLSLLFITGFLVYGALLIRHFFTDRRQQLLCISLFAFWPAGVIHSTRIGNDSLTAMLSVATIYYLSKWLAYRSRRSLILTGGMTFLSPLCKASALAAAATASLLSFCALVQGTFHRSKVKPFLFITSLALLGISLSFAFKHFLAQDPTSDWLVGKVMQSLNPRLIVPNAPKDFLFPDFTIYLSHPFTDSWKDELGRQNFWNYLLKTSLFGEFQFKPESLQLVALLLGVLLLVQVALTLTTCLLKGNSFQRSISPLAIFLILSILSLAVFRLKAPSASNADFRYILSCLPAFCVISVRGASRLPNLRFFPLRILAYVAQISFVSLSVLFILLLASTEIFGLDIFQQTDIQYLLHLNSSFWQGL